MNNLLNDVSYKPVLVTNYPYIEQFSLINYTDDLENTLDNIGDTLLLPITKLADN